MNRKALALLTAASLAACSSPAKRIKQHQADYDASAPEIQQAIKDGRAVVGMTAVQVEMALGKPDRTYNRQTKESQQDVWAYGARGPRPGIGLGVGVFGGGPTIYGGGVSVGSGDAYDYEDRTRVVFESGRVVSVESRQK